MSTPTVAEPDTGNQTQSEGLALVFPGQGSQRPGMAREWQGTRPFERWRQADELLGRNVTRLGLDAGEDELRQPVNCQIGLFVHGTVLLDAWLAHGARPVAVAGHSLGEYNALVAAGALRFADALRLVDARARCTQAAADARPGTMLACLGFPVELVAAACEEAGAYVANDNAPGQVVISGSRAALDRARDALAAMGERGKVVTLDVGAAYHSPHMAAAVDVLGAALDRATFEAASVPVVANVDAQPHLDAPEWPTLLRQQVVSPVRWRETVGTLAGLGARQIVELGASAVLTGMVKRIDRSLTRRTVIIPADLQEAA